MIGLPNESERSFVTDQKALEYLDTFPNMAKADLKAKYPAID